MVQKKFLVGEYMSTRHVTISRTATLRDAVERMIKEETNGLVVVDTENKVVGILSSWDVIKQIVPDYLETEDNLAAFEAESVFAKRVAEVKDSPR